MENKSKSVITPEETKLEKLLNVFRTVSIEAGRDVNIRNLVLGMSKEEGEEQFKLINDKLKEYDSKLNEIEKQIRTLKDEDKELSGELYTEKEELTARKRELVQLRPLVKNANEERKEEIGKGKTIEEKDKKESSPKSKERKEKNWKTLLWLIPLILGLAIGLFLYNYCKLIIGDECFHHVYYLFYFEILHFSILFIVILYYYKKKKPVHYTWKAQVCIFLLSIMLTAISFYLLVHAQPAPTIGESFLWVLYGGITSSWCASFESFLFWSKSFACLLVFISFFIIELFNEKRIFKAMAKTFILLLSIFLLFVIFMVWAIFFLKKQA